ncbi:MAG: glucosaminidase domain-containing protein [Firmicutes bacterium]|nr:glucosaminidase domain-containing protein [Bacillota bacterium]
MADHEIRITPKVDLRELTDLQRHLDQMARTMDTIAQASQKIRIPGIGSGDATQDRAQVLHEASMGRQRVRRNPMAETLDRVMPVSSQRVAARRGRSGSTPEDAQTPGGLLNWIMSVFLPDQPTIQEMTSTPHGINLGKLSPSVRAKLPTFLYQPSAWKSKPQTPTEYAEAAGSIPGFETLSPTAQKAALDAVTGGYTPVNLDQLRKQQQQTQQAIFQAYRQSGGGTGSGGSGGLGAGPRALLGAAGLGGVTDLIGTLGPWGAAVLGVGYVADQTKQGWSTYHTQGSAFSAISKSAGDLGESFNVLRNKVNATGLQFAESLTTITAVTQSYLPFVGNLSTARLTNALTAAQGTAFAYGLNPTSTTQAFGQAAALGITATGGSGGQMTPAQWAALIANATSQGNMQGRTGQVLTSMLSVSQAIAQQIAGTPNQNALAAIMTGLNQSGNAMLQGSNGAAILNSLNAGITNPGSGAAGELFTLNAINPGRKLSYFQARNLQAQGLTGINPYTGNTNFAAELQSMYRMLPGGKVTGSTINGQWVPSVQTAGVAGILAPVMHLTQPQMIRVLQAFQGKSLSSMNATETLANQLGGTHALPNLLKKGGINVFAQIANATTLHQLTSAAHDITGNLHGSVSHAFYTAQKQYEALGKVHPTSAQQAATLAHERTVEFNRMKDALGKSVLAGPTLMTSMDQLNQTMQKANANWSNIARTLKPFAQIGATLDQTLSGNLLKTIKHPGWDEPGVGTAKPWSGLHTILHDFTTTYHSSTSAHTAAYQPWIGTRSTASPSAQLASFVMGNMQSGVSLPFLSAPSGFSTTSYTPPANTGAFLQQMMPYANQVAHSTGLSPALLLAQWGLESQWGTSTAAQQNHNLGGIKPWGPYGPGADRKYAGYSSLSAFAQGDAAFYNENSNYRALENAARAGASVAQQAQLLGQSGYATDPAYTQKLLNVLMQIESALSSGGMKLVQA